MRLRTCVPKFGWYFGTSRVTDGLNQAARVFSWNHANKSLGRTLKHIQQAAGIYLPCQ